LNQYPYSGHLWFRRDFGYYMTHSLYMIFGIPMYYRFPNTNSLIGFLYNISVYVEICTKCHSFKSWNIRINCISSISRIVSDQHMGTDSNYRNFTIFISIIHLTQWHILLDTLQSFPCKLQNIIFWTVTAPTAI